jgi:alpha-galactosidase
MAVALFGHTGFEWDLTTTSALERAELAKFVELAKSLREVLHAGTFVELDRPDAGTTAFGVVDDGQAVFLLARTATDTREGAAALRLAGLDSEASYLVERISVSGQPDERIGELTGRQLMAVGLPAPGLEPDQAAIFRLSATSS